MGGDLRWKELWRARAPGLALGAVLAGALLWASWPTLLTLARCWASDPQYSHGFVVPVFSLLVLWLRRGSFPAGPLRASWWAVPLLLLAAGLRLSGAVLFFNWLDGFSLLLSLAGLVLLLGGVPALRWSWPGLALLLFLLPLPWQVDILLAGPLRRLATLGSTFALQTLGLPALAEGNVIVIDDIKIGVVEACSGLGMLMTFFALSTAVALVVQRPLLDRSVVLLSAIPVGLLLNVARITVTALLYRWAGADVAKAIFHDVAGWVMMPLALAVLWLELCFLDRLYRPVAGTRPAPGGRPIPVPRPVPVADPTSRPDTRASASLHTKSRERRAGLEPAAVSGRSLLEVPHAAP
jgi:exosortase